MSIERRIAIGLITSTEFLQQIYSVWDTSLLESQMARRISTWCIEYFDTYNKAPNKDIEGIFLQHLKAETIPEEVAEEIEQDILPSLSDQYEEEQFNLSYLLDQTRDYLKERYLLQFSEQIEGFIRDGELTEAEKLACDYKPIGAGAGTDVDLSTDVALDRVQKAFEELAKPIITYPKALGEFWNIQLRRGAFVALMASEKRGKSYWLLNLGIKAARQKARVAFFQAGDMTEDEQLVRLCVHLTHTSNIKKYCSTHFRVVRDCLHNQLDNCDREDRDCDFGIFPDKSEDEIRKVTLKELRTTSRSNKDYVPCSSCEAFKGVPWIKRIKRKDPLKVSDAKKKIEEFFIKNKRRFKLSTHANGTLSIKEIKALLDIWEKEDDFIPDVIIVDYADLLVAETRVEFRHQQNEIWKGLRNLSQERHSLVITATQADAASYEKDRLTLSNFSEDKRKYAHVTAMYGLNQDRYGREKALGLMRINEIVIREGDFSSNKEVTIIQDLRQGQPFLGSYW